VARPERPIVIAHRGASAYRPENTLPAYELAVEMGADMIEIDLHRCRSGEVVIRHDAEIEALGHGRWIGDAEQGELRSLDMGAGEVMPLLDEVLDRFGDRIPFNLEIKWGRAGPYPGLEQIALDAVRSRGLLERTLFSSFNDAVLATLRELEPDARLGCLVDPRHPERPFERAEAVRAEAVNPWWGLATADLIGEAHARDLAVYPYTVNDRDEMAALLERGADGMFTNHPDDLRALLRPPGKSQTPL
jgi:glycerophosphoryl diester phosphodiesterase